MGKKRRRRDKNGVNPMPDPYDPYFSWIIPEEPAPERPEIRYETPLVTGVELFDDPFHTVKPPPPLGPADPCYATWLVLVEKSEERFKACPKGERSRKCDLAREASWESARQYADCMDQHWGLQRYENGELITEKNKKEKAKKQAKKEAKKKAKDMKKSNGNNSNATHVTDSSHTKNRT